MAAIDVPTSSKRLDSDRRQPEETPPTLQGDLVAVVDDDKWIRDSLARFLKSTGFGVETFDSAEDYLQHGDRNNTACIILDVRLPKMNGFDLERQLANEHCRVPIVFMSAHDESEMKRRALQVGVVRFLRKPIHDESLLEAVYSALK